MLICAKTIVNLNACPSARVALPPPRPPSLAPPQGILDCLRELYEERGLEGLYAGLSSKLAFTVAAAAFMFAVYERLATRVVAATRPRLKTKSR